MLLNFQTAPLLVSWITEQNAYLETLLTIIILFVLIFSGYVCSCVLCVFWELYHATRRWRAVINLCAAGWLGCRSVIAACARGSAYPFTSYNREQELPISPSHGSNGGKSTIKSAKQNFNCGSVSNYAIIFIQTPKRRTYVLTAPCLLCSPTCADLFQHILSFSTSIQTVRQ